MCERSSAACRCWPRWSIARRLEAIDLNNGVTIEILTASFRTVRGYTLIAALLDEIAFWRSDEGYANPDTEIVAAIRPAMASVPGAMLLCASVRTPGAACCGTRTGNR